MRNYFVLLLSLLTFLTGLLSCRDHQIPAAQRFRIRQETFAVNSTTNGYTTYNYNADNKLVNTQYYTVSATQAPFLSRKATFTYDSKGRLTGVEGVTYPATPNATVDFSSRIIYGYDENSRVTTIKKYQVPSNNPGSPLLTEDIQLSYGTGDLPIKLTRKVNNGSQFDPQIDMSEEYSYSGGNVVTINYAYAPTRSNGYKASTRTETRQYDDKTNAFYGLILESQDVRTISKNNQTEADRNYTYNTNGLLTQVALRDGSSSTSYDYEPY